MTSYILGEVNLNEEKLQEDFATMKSFPHIAEAHAEFSSDFWMNNSL